MKKNGSFFFNSLTPKEKTTKALSMFTSAISLLEEANVEMEKSIDYNKSEISRLQIENTECSNAISKNDSIVSKLKKLIE